MQSTDSKKSSAAALRLLIVDDHDVVLRGLAQIAAETLPPGTDVLTAQSGAEALRLLRAEPCQMCLLDVELPDVNGVGLLRSLRKEFPLLRVIVCSAHDELWYVKSFLDAHVEGILFKSVYAREIVDALLAVAAGRTYYCRQVEGMRKTILAYDAPTRREVDVLRHLAAGRSTKEMADAMCVSENTVETHRRHLLEKFHARNVAELIACAYRDKLLP